MTRNVRLLRVCVTGPESTGKTTLASRLAEWAGTTWSAEAARAYAESRGAELDASDVEPIAAAQAALEDDAMLRAHAAGAGIVVLDTDLMSTVTYAAHYYGDVPAAVRTAAAARRAELYLLCDVDVPWIPDGVRDRPANRDEMFTLFAQTLRDAGITPVIVRGDWDERFRVALDAVAALLDDHGKATA